jgi:hypothetical protein
VRKQLVPVQELHSAYRYFKASIVIRIDFTGKSGFHLVQKRRWFLDAKVRRGPECGFPSQFKITVLFISTALLFFFQFNYESHSSDIPVCVFLDVSTAPELLLVRFESLSS